MLIVAIAAGILAGFATAAGVGGPLGVPVEEAPRGAAWVLLSTSAGALAGYGLGW